MLPPHAEQKTLRVPDTQWVNKDYVICFRKKASPDNFILNFYHRRFFHARKRDIFKFDNYNSELMELFVTSQ